VQAISAKINVLEKAVAINRFLLMSLQEEFGKEKSDDIRETISKAQNLIMEEEGKEVEMIGVT